MAKKTSLFGHGGATKKRVGGGKRQKKKNNGGGQFGEEEITPGEKEGGPLLRGKIQ